MDQRTRLERRQEARRRLVRQRRLTAAAILLALIVGIAVLLGSLGGGDSSGAGGGASAAAKRKAPPPPPELPRGGRKLFPRYRLVGFYGAPQDDALGALGIGTPAQAAARLRKAARPYRRGGRVVLPTFELIATVASGAPGNDGSYSYRQSFTVIDRYLRAARKERALLVLDIQPGRVDFMDEVKRLRPYLEQPDVALALDPEWRVGPGQIPGKVIGSVGAPEVNRVLTYVRGIVQARRLPQKLVLIHQFTPNMIRGKATLRRYSELALTINVDGFGDPPNKIAKYTEFARESRRFHKGFKLFYSEDTNLMSPQAVLKLRPRPEIIVYE
ncbi:MAG: hypothetical protein QOJ07_2979 [Thermoleophilaceae bacterium]|nr:hypothetical protein [Thermoleophilaceae bacterium]